MKNSMTTSETIICKPTPWFLFRAGVILTLFSVFGVLFYIDGSTGYRKKNENFYLHKTFQAANAKFAELNTKGALTAAEWQTFAAGQSVAYPSDPALLPADIKLPVAWPAILQDFERMKPLQWNLLWLDYTKERGLAADPPDEPYSMRKINEQWLVGGVCVVLASAAAFILLRTLRRSISVDSEAVTTQQGKRVPYTDLKKLDLRKWESKGLAFIEYDGPSGKGRIRVDGLTYGGFKKEQDEPAERLMKQIRSHFSGEITEYVSTPATPTPAENSESA
jgi:hypothetical protein